MDMTWLEPLMPALRWVSHLLTPNEWYEFAWVIMMTYAMSYIANLFFRVFFPEGFLRKVTMQTVVIIFGGISAWKHWPPDAPTLDMWEVGLLAGVASILTYHLLILSLRLLPTWLGRDNITMFVKGTRNRRKEARLIEKDRRKQPRQIPEKI